MTQEPQLLVFADWIQTDDSVFSPGMIVEFHMIKSFSVFVLFFYVYLFASGFLFVWLYVFTFAFSFLSICIRYEFRLSSVFDWLASCHLCMAKIQVVKCV